MMQPTWRFVFSTYQTNATRIVRLPHSFTKPHEFVPQAFYHNRWNGPALLSNLLQASLFRVIATGKYAKNKKRRHARPGQIRNETSPDDVALHETGLPEGRFETYTFQQWRKILIWNHLNFENLLISSQWLNFENWTYPMLGLPEKTGHCVLPA